MVRLSIVSLLLFFPWFLSAASVGSLVSLEGEVSVLRGGVVIPSEKLSDGYLLEDFDTITTGASGRADIVSAPSTGVESRVHMESGTSLYLDVSPWKREQPFGVELLAGAVAVIVSSTIGVSAVEVRTEMGTFLGAGPRFRVYDSPQGDVLVLSEAGKVLCRAGERSVSADPGAMVEVLAPGRKVRTIPVNPSTLDSAATSWSSQRNQVFREQAEGYLKSLGSRYLWQGGLFQRAWGRIESVKDDPVQSQRAVANLRRAAAPLERSVVRMAALRNLFDEGLLASTAELARGYSAKDFFGQVAQDAPSFAVRLGQARALYRNVADRNGGDFPVASDGSLVTWDSDFFH